MNKKTFIKAMLVGLMVFLPIFLFAIIFLSPKNGAFAISALLISLFFSIFCLVALLGYLFRLKTSNNELLYESVKTSLRQGALISIYVIAILGLSVIQLLTWWDSILLALSLILFEIYFKSSREAK